jgi:hypothetical protein
MATTMEERVQVLETEMRTLKRAAQVFLNPPPQKKRRLDGMSPIVYMDDSVIMFQDGSVERPRAKQWSPFTQTQPRVDPSVLGPC